MVSYQSPCDEHSTVRNPIIRTFFDRPTGSVQYVFHDPETMRGAIVDPVWNFYPEAGAVTTKCADEILAYVIETGITIVWVLDTHPHADHFSAAPYLAEKLGAPIGIGAKVTDVQKLWKRLYLSFPKIISARSDDAIRTGWA